MKKEQLRINGGLVLCENCDTPASWEYSINVGWVGCSPCMSGEARSFNPDDLIAEDCIDQFLKEFNLKKKK